MEKRWCSACHIHCSRCRSKGVFLVRCSRPLRGPEAMHWTGDGGGRGACPYTCLIASALSTKHCTPRSAGS